MFLGIIFFLELTAGVLAFVFKDWIKDQLNFFINNNIRAYRDDIDLQNLIDFTQEYVSMVFFSIPSADSTRVLCCPAEYGILCVCLTLQWECCGAFGADDWNLNIYFNCTDSNPSREKCGVPFSCCTKDPAVCLPILQTVHSLMVQHNQPEGVICCFLVFFVCLWVLFFLCFFRFGIQTEYRLLVVAGNFEGLPGER